MPSASFCCPCCISDAWLCMCTHIDACLALHTTMRVCVRPSLHIKHTHTHKLSLSLSPARARSLVLFLPMSLALSMSLSLPRCLSVCVAFSLALSHRFIALDAGVGVGPSGHLARDRAAPVSSAGGTLAQARSSLCCPTVESPRSQQDGPGAARASCLPQSGTGDAEARIAPGRAAGDEGRAGAGQHRGSYSSPKQVCARPAPPCRAPARPCLGVLCAASPHLLRSSSGAAAVHHFCTSTFKFISIFPPGQVGGELR